MSKKPQDHEERIRAAEKVALWHLGDPIWASVLVDAYWNPGNALDEISAEVDL